MLFKPTFALLIALLGTSVHANYLQKATLSETLPGNGQHINPVPVAQLNTIPSFSTSTAVGGTLSKSTVYYQYGNNEPQGNYQNSVYTPVVSGSPYAYSSSSNVPAASANYGVVGTAALSDYGPTEVVSGNTVHDTESLNVEAPVSAPEPIGDEYGGVASQNTYTGYSNGAPATDAVIGHKGYAAYGSGAEVNPAYVPAAGISGFVGLGAPLAGYRTGAACSGPSCDGYHGGAVVGYPVSTGYQTGRYYQPGPYLKAPFYAIRTSHSAPVGLGQNVHSSLGLGKLGEGLEKFIDLDKLEKLLPLDLLKNLLPGGKSGISLDGLLGGVASIPLPSLTINVPHGHGPKGMLEQLVTSSQNAIPTIKVPAHTPHTASSHLASVLPVHGHASAVSVSKIPVAPIGPSVKLIKQFPSLSFSKLKLPEMPSFHSITESLGNLGSFGDLLSKFVKFDNGVKRTKLSPAPMSVTPRKIVTAYPLQKGSLSGHVVIEDFPYGRPQYGPLDEGPEVPLGCAELDSAVPSPVKYAH